MSPPVLAQATDSLMLHASSHGGCCTVQGKRPYNEDRHVLDEKFHNVRTADSQDSWLQLFGVFDGHGGSKVSEFCASSLPGMLKQSLETAQSALHDVIAEDSVNRLASSSECQPIQRVAKCLAHAFESVDKALSEHAILQDEAKLMGTTAVTALISRQHIWVANCGDSRAVICRGGIATPLTSDHKATCPREAARVAQAGGVIVRNSGHRLMGILAVTRAIGDHALHPHGLTPTPEVTYYRRSPLDDFLILASDGLWDVLTDQEAVDLVCRVFARAKGHSSAVKASALPRIAASVLTRVALARGSEDNITATIVDLRQPTGSRQHLLDIPSTDSNMSFSSLSGLTSSELMCGGSVMPSCTRTGTAGTTGTTGASASGAPVAAGLSVSPSVSPAAVTPQGRAAACQALTGRGVDGASVASPFAAEAEAVTSRKRSLGEAGCVEARASKRAHSLRSVLSASGCSGEMIGVEVQRSGMLAAANQLAF